MSVGLVCPACSSGVNFIRPPVLVCPSCGGEFPDQLRSTAEATLRRQEAPRPLFLSIGVYGSGALAIALLGSVLGAPLNVLNYTVNGEPVSGLQFLRAAGFELGVLGLVSAGICYGLWKERTWSRPLMVFFWVFLTAIQVGVALGSDERITNVTAALLAGAIMLGPVAAYLYFKNNVVEYYRALKVTETEHVVTKGHDA